MSASVSSSSPESSVQRRIGTALSDAADRFADRASGLDPIAAKYRAALDPVVGRSAPATLREAVNSTWLGHPIHPILVTLPIGAWTLTSVFDLLDENRAADLCLRAGVVAAGSAALTGAAQWDTVADRHRPRRIGVIHASLNTAATSVYIASWVLRSRGKRTAGVATAAAGLGITAFSGWLGGHLSYTLGVGVEDTAVCRREVDEDVPGSFDEAVTDTSH
ncbi:MAG TPA: DUF2231 domain-containing protein [Thermomicrobiales bacterium]|nr:DUF2231 domain-containing protein [Thermomicrobiales bacterium]